MHSLRYSRRHQKEFQITANCELNNRISKPDSHLHRETALLYAMLAVVQLSVVKPAV
jgi:hypothetical protein